MKEILDSISYSDEISKISRFFSRFRSYNKKKTMTLIRMLKEGVLDSAFPPHDVVTFFNNNKIL
jgi:hypothetical protein